MLQPNKLAYGLSLLLIALMGACNTAPQTEESASESTTESSAVPALEPATQIVALTSLTADIIHTMDAEKLVGISGSSVLAEDQRFQGLEVVSQGRTEPDLEKIISLKPDLVIGAQGFHDKTLERLGELNISTLSVNVGSWEELKQLTQDLAQRIDADPQPLTKRYDSCLAQAQDSAPSVLVLVSRQPLLSPNQKSWAGDFLQRFNMENLTSDFQGDSPIEGYITLSEEKLLSSNPETLLVVETRREENLLQQLQENPFWNKLQATQTEQIHSFEYYGLVNPGSIASIEKTCKKLAEINQNQI
ncbi:MAG: ABC transporter substrate-binding protein [Cyanobacteria bacterium P01_F01_bin.42]